MRFADCSPISPWELATKVIRNSEGSSEWSGQKDRTVFARAIAQFHEKIGVFNSQVSGLIDELESGAKIIRFAHQPNLFAYLNIPAHLAYIDRACHELTRMGVRAVPVFFVVDYDRATDRRLNSAALPCAVCKTGRRNLGSGLPRKQRHRFIKDIPAEHIDTSNWASSWEGTIEDLQGDLVPMDPTVLFEGMKTPLEILPKLGSEASISDAFCAYLARLCWYQMGIRCLFLPLSSCLHHMNAAASSLLDGLSQIEPCESGGRSGNRLPLWGACPECNSRARLFRDNSGVYLDCEKCGANVREVGRKVLSEPFSLFGGVTVPDVTLDYLLDYSGYRIAGGSGYATGLSAAMNARSVLQSIGGRPPPESFWRLNLLFPGPTESAVYKYAVSKRLEGGALPDGMLKMINMSRIGQYSSAFFACLPSIGRPVWKQIIEHLGNGNPSRQLEVYLPERLVSLGLQERVIHFLRNF